MIPPIVVPEVTDFTTLAICEFCLNCIYEADPHACIKYDQSVIAFHQDCYTKALKNPGWFSRFWTHEKEKHELYAHK
jgi:hypothetical protein